MRGDLQGIGPFKLIGVLGEGEHAIVYDAERDGQPAAPPVALKLLRPELARDDDAIAAFTARAAHAARLSHPAVVSCYERGDVDGRPFAVMEKVDGVALTELFGRRGRGRLSNTAASTVLDSVLSALSAAAMGDPACAHGRLQPDNVLIDTDGDVRLTSFGTDAEPQADFLALARLAQRLTPEWPAEVDGWLDGLQDGEGSFADIGVAHAAFPLRASTEGRRALARAVKRVIKKREKAANATNAPESLDFSTENSTAPNVPGTSPNVPGGATPNVPGTSPNVPGTGSPRRPKPRRVARGGLRHDATTGSVPTEVAALGQARLVGWACLSLACLALLIEILGFSGR